MKVQLLELMKALVDQRKSLMLFSKTNTKFCLSFHYNADNFHLFVNKKEILKLTAYNKNANFPTQFFPGSISNKFNVTVFTEVSLNENVYDFSVHYNSICKSGIFKIDKYLVIKNNIKQCSSLLSNWIIESQWLFSN